MDPQNTNARYLDKFSKGNHTNVLISNPPGGKSTISLGWEEPKPKIQSKENLQQVNDQYKNQNLSGNNNYDNITGTGGRKKVNNNYQDSDIFSNNKGNQPQDNFKNYGAQSKPNNQFEPSVKVSNAPGGKSNFQFGYDDTNYNNYKK